MLTFISTRSKHFYTCFLAIHSFLFIAIYVSKESMRLHEYVPQENVAYISDNQSLPVELYDRICEPSELLQRHAMIIFSAFTGILKISFKTVAAVGKCTGRGDKTAVFPLTRVFREMLNLENLGRKRAKLLVRNATSLPSIEYFSFLSYRQFSVFFEP